MNFLFNEEQLSLGETVAQALADFPALTEPDPSNAADGAVWNALAELGLFSLLVPEAHGGLNLTITDLAPSIEALGAGLAPPLIASTLVATEVLKREGSASQQERYLPLIAGGSMAIAIASAEAGRGNDPHRAVVSLRDGRLNGSKIAVSGAASAAALLVVASSRAGPVVVLVPADRPGIALAAHEDIDPSASLCRVAFTDVAVDAADVIGTSDGAALECLIDLGATVQAGMAMGIAAVMLERSVGYARERVQFGQPIGAFQAIKHRCADLAVAVEAGKATAHFAFWACGEDDPERSRAASSAKAYCGEIACNACNDAVQIHGGMGFTWEMGLHRFLRRAQLIEHAVGNRSWHYDRVVEHTLALRLAPHASRRDAA